MRKLRVLSIAIVSLAAHGARAQTSAPATLDPAPAASVPAPEPAAYETVVTATTPLHGSGLPLDHVPANVQTITSEDLAEHRSLDLAGYMGEALGSVHINDVQGNPLQPDLQYRGFLASPLLGAPQGLSMYLDGVRLNEPFGDTINWDLLPTNAIRSVNLIPGSNPVFGLNTLGGALSLETKTGFSDPGADGTLLYGSWGRKLARANAGAHGAHFGVFAAADVFDEDGWREQSPSRAEHAFLSTSYESGGSTVDLSLMGANTTLTGNGVAPLQLLDTDRRAVFTAPDRQENQLFMALLRGDRPLATHAHLSGTAYVRTNHTQSINGDQHDWVECIATPGTLCAQNDDGTQTPILDGQKQGVKFDDAYDAADNRTDTRQTSYGVAAQLAVDAPLVKRENHLFVGADAAQSRIRFRSTTTVGTFDVHRNTIDDGFLDPTSPISVDSVANDLGVYATDTFSIRRDLHFVASGRLNVTKLSLTDELDTGLTGAHTFDRVNPAAGLSYQPRPSLGGYVSYSESNRAPTTIELTCASPTDPCRLPNAFVSDPPARAQVVATTIEAGVRGQRVAARACCSRTTSRASARRTPTTSSSSARVRSPTRGTSRTSATRAVRVSRRISRVGSASAVARGSSGRCTTRSRTLASNSRSTSGARTTRKPTRTACSTSRRARASRRSPSTSRRPDSPTSRPSACPWARTPSPTAASTTAATR